VKAFVVSTGEITSVALVHACLFCEFLYRLGFYGSSEE